MPWRLWTNIITVGTPAPATSAASCSGPEGRRWDTPQVSPMAASHSAMSSGWNGRGSICQSRSQLRRTLPSFAKRSLAARASVSIRGTDPQMTYTTLNGQTMASTGWYDQKAIAIFLSLLYLGVRKIKVGPTLPEYFLQYLAKHLPEGCEVTTVAASN